MSTKPDDAVSRQAVMAAIYDLVPPATKVPNLNPLVKMLETRIYGLPPVQLGPSGPSRSREGPDYEAMWRGLINEIAMTEDDKLRNKMEELMEEVDRDHNEFLSTEPFESEVQEEKTDEKKQG